MSGIKTCGHLNEVTDEHEGTIICIDCGLVLSNHFFFEENKQSDNKNDKEAYKEILSKLNLSEMIADNLSSLKNENMSSIASNLYLEINKNSCISIKEISSVTGICEKKISLKTKGTINVLDKQKILEKYCKELDLSFKNYSVIKEIVNKTQLSGHNPLTVIASCLYLYCKKNSIKISMKKVSSVIGISCISIQRFLKSYKNELSYWC